MGGRADALLSPRDPLPCVFSLNVPVPGKVRRVAGDLHPELVGFDRVRERHTLLAKRFDTALDDDGEDGYANWWQVERLDGTRLGRRELLHAHSEQPFTRSATVEIPDDVACVIVRGHDETHGYGGRAAAVDLASGTSRSVDQGPERRPIDPGECPTG